MAAHIAVKTAVFPILVFSEEKRKSLRILSESDVGLVCALTTCYAHMH